MDHPKAVDFHFDIMCPYAYQTSLWMREVRDLIDIEVRWKFFSLEEINRAEGKKHPWERQWSYGWSMMRIGANENCVTMKAPRPRSADKSSYSVSALSKCAVSIDGWPSG